MAFRMYLAGRCRRGVTQTEVLLVSSLVAVALAVLAVVAPSINGRRSHPPGFFNSTNLRGVHQSMVVFAQNNNGYLPGLDSYGKPLAPGSSLLHPSGQTSGASMSARYYILLNGSFIDPSLLINPNERGSLSKTPVGVEPTSANFSYALLRIGNSATTTDGAGQEPRQAEWRDNANSEAILISDRNTNASVPGGPIRSVWSTASKGDDWKGTVLWGDNHAEFLNAPQARLGSLSLNTRYNGVLNSNDFLFSEVSSPGKDGRASAMFGDTSSNY